MRYGGLQRIQLKITRYGVQELLINLTIVEIFLGRGMVGESGGAVPYWGILRILHCDVVVCSKYHDSVLTTNHKVKTSKNEFQLIILPRLEVLARQVDHSVEHAKSAVRVAVELAERQIEALAELVDVPRISKLVP